MDAGITHTPDYPVESDHEWYVKLQAGEDTAWKRLWFEVIVPETRSLRNAQLMRKYSLTAGDLNGLLFEDMMGRGRFALYRDDGGSLASWLRCYVRGYITRANPAAHGEFSLDAAARQDARGEALPIPTEDRGVLRAETWAMTHRCFKDLWNDDPRKAYVLLLKTRFHLSSQEVADMLDISNAAAVDQIFSRAVKAMRAAWPHHDRKG
jgi:DNA-directed RNA polymerase specialized sigma24 family protein